MTRPFPCIFSLAVLALAQLATIANAQEVINVFRWVVPYNGPKVFEANVGDTIIFRWAQGSHNVFIHPTMSCDLAGAIEVGQSPGTQYTFTQADAGTEMFFACDIGMGAHCFAGQSITVSVSDADITTDTVTPTTDVPTTESPTDAPTGGSSSTESTVIPAANASPSPAPNSTEASVVDPVPAPTDTPTVTSVPAPTDAPTVAPVPAPTDAPTVAPVASPTDAPIETAVSASESSSASQTSVTGMAMIVACASFGLVVA
eukprot:jgi/Psemu1/283905/fgenesh1_pg.36_\